MKPLVSITVMIRDSGPILDELLKRIVKQKTSIPYEIVFLYFGKRTETLEKLRKYSTNITQIKPEDFDYGKSRDLVCSKCLGEYIITMSVDALPKNNNWLNEMINLLINNKADIVQGEVACPEDGDPNYPNFFYWEKNYWQYYSCEGDSFIRRYGNISFSCVNLAFKKKVWEKAKFGGVVYCEDKLFQKRAYKSGFISIYNEKAVTLHAHSYSTIKKAFQRSANEGLGWKQLGESYNIIRLGKDLLRFDMHFLGFKSLLEGKLKYNSEILYFFIRPFSLYWGSHYLKKVY